MTSEDVSTVLPSLMTLVEHSRRLRVVFVECASASAQNDFREKFEAAVTDAGKSFRVPPGATAPVMLGWLEEEVQHGQRHPESEIICPVRYFLLPEGRTNETFVLHRLNENRDNVRGALKGVLCIVGGPGMLQRVFYEAPDLSSIRERAFLVPDQKMEGETGAAEAEPKNERLVSATKPPAVLLTYAGHDEGVAKELSRRLERDGLPLASSDHTEKDAGAPGTKYFEAIRHSQAIIAILSDAYLSAVWPAVERAAEHLRIQELLRRRTIVLRARDTVVPQALRDVDVLDFRDEQAREAAYDAIKTRILRAGELGELGEDGETDQPPASSQQVKRRSRLRRVIDIITVLVGVGGIGALSLRCAEDACAEAGNLCEQVCYVKRNFACTAAADKYLSEIRPESEWQFRYGKEAHALRFYEMGCMNRSPGACYGIALMILDPTRTVPPKDAHVAARHLLFACEGAPVERRIPGACGELAMFYLDGRGGVPKDDVRAAELLRRACDGDTPTHCFALGEMYQDGRGGLSADPVQARRMFQRACNATNMHACDRLGFRVGNEVSVKVTLVREDFENLDCASEMEIAGLRCAYTDRGGEKREKDARTLRPYMTVADPESMMILASGPWNQEEFIRNNLPVARFTAQCTYRIEGMQDSVFVRWNPHDRWYAPRKVFVGALHDCKVVTGQ